MVAGRRRVETGVDPAEQHFEARSNDIAQALVLRRLQVRRARPA
jgi:ribosomal protein L19